MERDRETQGGPLGEQGGQGDEEQGGYGGHTEGRDPLQGEERDQGEMENDQDSREGGYGGDDPTDLDLDGRDIGA